MVAGSLLLAVGRARWPGCSWQCVLCLRFCSVTDVDALHSCMLYGPGHSLTNWAEDEERTYRRCDWRTHACGLVCHGEEKELGAASAQLGRVHHNLQATILGGCGQCSQSVERVPLECPGLVRVGCMLLRSTAEPFGVAFPHGTAGVVHACIVLLQCGAGTGACVGTCAVSRRTAAADLQ